MRRVVLESPFRGRTPEEEARNIAYLHHCMRHALSLGESPYASHELFTRALKDADPEQRALGIKAGFAWREPAEASIVCIDLGVSGGMHLGIIDSYEKSKPIEFRWLFGNGEASSEPRKDLLEHGSKFTHARNEAGFYETCLVGLSRGAYEAAYKAGYFEYRSWLYLADVLR